MPRLAFIRPYPLCSRPPAQGRRLAGRAQVGWLSLPDDQTWQWCAALLKSGAE